MAKKLLSYQELNAELESLLSSMQSGELDIDESVRSYERGMELLKAMDDYLKKSENKVTKIKTTFETN